MLNKTRLEQQGQTQSGQQYRGMINIIMTEKYQ